MTATQLHYHKSGTLLRSCLGLSCDPSDAEYISKTEVEEVPAEELNSRFGTNYPVPEQRDGNVGARPSGPSTDNVAELIDGRVDVYGDPVKGFVRHAQVWSGILGVEVQPWQVALCMVGYKLVRTGVTPDYSDNSDDVDGYMDIFRQLMGDEMVHARDTAAYLAGGGQGARS